MHLSFFKIKKLKIIGWYISRDGEKKNNYRINHTLYHVTK